MDETLGARIREARLAAGLTLRDLARSIGVSETTLRNWEGSQNTPRPDLASRLQDQLGVDLGFGQFTPALRSVDSPSTPKRGKRQAAQRMDDATVPQLLAELHGRDARTAEQLREARSRITELEAEVARLQQSGPVGLDEARRRFAARNDSPPDTP